MTTLDWCKLVVILLCEYVVVDLRNNKVPPP